MATKHSIIGLKELRERTGSFIARVRKGESFTVVRRSKPIFHIASPDVWGDEGMWETVADFRDIDERGVPLEDALRALKRLNG